MTSTHPRAFKGVYPIEGDWYDFHLDLFIPKGVDFPKGWPEIIKWVAAGDNGTFISDVSLKIAETP